MNDISVFLSILSMVLIAISDLFYKIYQKSTSPSIGTFMAIQGTTFMIFVSSVALIEGFNISTIASVIACVCGILVFTSLTMFMVSLKGGEVVTNVATFRLNFVYAAVLSVFFLGELLTIYRIAGLALTTSAVLIFSRSEPKSSKNSESLLVAFIASVIFAVANTLYKVALSIGSSASSFLTVQSIVYLISSLVYSRAHEKSSFSFSKKTIYLAVACGVLQALAFLFMLWALQCGVAIVVIPITQVSFILTALLAIFLLKEKTNLYKIVALFLAIGAIVFFAI
ncbi:MAG: GRP family sugar transporter [Candidatus Korarchaeota archaeon]